LLNETKLLVVNWQTLHYKLQCPFCGAPYYQSKGKNGAVPFGQLTFGRLSFYLQIAPPLQKKDPKNVLTRVLFSKYVKN
jgi:hypothetical protein